MTFTCYYVLCVNLNKNFIVLFLLMFVAHGKTLSARDYTKLISSIKYKVKFQLVELILKNLVSEKLCSQQTLAVEIKTAQTFLPVFL